MPMRVLSMVLRSVIGLPEAARARMVPAATRMTYGLALLTQGITISSLNWSVVRCVLMPI